jgi:phage terminase large subunit-like protein
MSELSVVEEISRRTEPNLLFEGLSQEQLEAVMHDWRLWRRPKQITPEGNWRVWLILAGRGFGKTRTGSEWVREQVELGKAGHIALVGATAADVRDTMIEGESGILSIFPDNERPRYEPSKRRITFHNGAMATAFSADEPDRLRGPNHDLAWCDELAAWRYPDAWDMLIFGLRIGEHPQALVTTTPRPTRIIRDLVHRKDVIVTHGSTFENKTNLAASFFEEIIERYEGTRLAGIDEAGHGYILEDVSKRGTPLEWANEAVAAYHRLKADRIVAEANQGGDMIRHTLNTVDRNIPLRLVHASRGKRVRAEPIAALYEQHKVHHVGSFPDLEDQLCSWVPDVSASPDRLDALVWALTELMIDGARHHAAVAPINIEQVNPWIPQ